MSISNNARGYATLKVISMRLKSVKNIQKITKSMKMVSAAKFAKAEKDLRIARPYGTAVSEFDSKVEVVDKDNKQAAAVVPANVKQKILQKKIKSFLKNILRAINRTKINQNLNLKSELNNIWSKGSISLSMCKIMFWLVKVLFCEMW